MWSMGVIVYILLGGYPPFYAENERELFRLTRMGDFEFHEEHWSGTSIGAKDLISELLHTNPNKRATAADVLNHPWMKSDKKLLMMQSLAKSQVNLKSTIAKTRFRKAIHSVSISFTVMNYQLGMSNCSLLVQNATTGAFPQGICWRECYFFGKEKGSASCSRLSMSLSVKAMIFV